MELLICGQYKENYKNKIFGLSIEKRFYVVTAAYNHTTDNWIVFGDYDQTTAMDLYGNVICEEEISYKFLEILNGDCKPENKEYPVCVWENNILNHLVTENDILLKFVKFGVMDISPIFDKIEYYFIRNFGQGILSYVLLVKDEHLDEVKTILTLCGCDNYYD